MQGLLIFLTLPLVASPAVQALSGSWTLTDAPSPIPQAIEQGLKGMGWIPAHLARIRMNHINNAYHSLDIKVTATEVIIGYQDGERQQLPLDGQRIAWKRGDGETFDVAVREQQGDLVQVYHAKDGQRTNVYHVDPAHGTLSLGVTVTSPRLPHPVTYTLHYHAAGRG
jgi:hypothetical protein